MRARRCAAALAAAIVLASGAAGCDRAASPPPEEEWKPAPVPEAKDFTLVVTAEPKAVLGEDLVFRVRVENRGTIPAKLNVPRLSRDSVSLRVRCQAFDTAWLDPIPVRESNRGAQRDPPETRDVPPGGSVEGEIRQTAVLPGRFVFTPAYECQALDRILTAAPVEVEVAPAPGGANLGARLETSHGTIDVRLHPELAYQTVTSFANLLRKGFFDGLRFHRVVKGFMAQGGDPTGTGWGGPGYMIRRELAGAKLPHRRGVLSMARQQQPDTAGSQFFLMFRDAPELDRMGYATFGEMTSGHDALSRFEALGSDAPDGSDQSPREPITITKATLVVLP